MEIKEPAAIFSETGLKIFIEAIKEFEKGKESGENIAVNQLIEEYKDYKEKPTTNENKMVILTERLADFFSDGETRNSKEILNFVNNVCGFQYDLRSITSLMRGAIKRNPSIVKLNTRQYKMEINEQLALENEEK